MLEFIGISLTVLALFWLVPRASRGRNQRRASEMAALAAEFGLSFDPQDAALWQRFTAFAGLTEGIDRRHFNTLSGILQAGDVRLDILAGDYEFKRGLGDNPRNTAVQTRWTYILARPDFRFDARLTLQRESLVTLARNAAGLRDIEFESAEFNRTYSVDCDDRRFAFDLIDARMMQWLIDNPAPRLITSGGQLLIAVEEQLSPNELRDLLRWLVGFMERWPRHMVAAGRSPASRAGD
jgi:hypothetical protein